MFALIRPNYHLTQLMHCDMGLHINIPWLKDHSHSVSSLVNMGGKDKGKTSGYLTVVPGIGLPKGKKKEDFTDWHNS